MQNYIFLLKPTMLKEKKLKDAAMTHKTVFEYTLKKQIKNYKENKAYINDNTLIKEFNKEKYLPKFKGFLSVSSNIINYSIHSATKYFIHCISNNTIPTSSTSQIKELHFYINKKLISIDYKENKIFIPKIKNILFEPNETLKEFQNLEIKNCKVYLNEEDNKWYVSFGAI